MSDDATESETFGPTSAAEEDSGHHSALVAAGILLSRISGLIRERALAHFFGTSFAADAYSAAVRIPNLMQNLLGEGVLSASFIPVYSKLLAEGREEEAGKVAGAIAGLLTVVAGLLALLGVVFAYPITRTLAPGLTGRTLELTVTLVRIVTPGIGFLVLSAWCLGVLNSHRRFFLSYVAPVIWNGAQIAFLVGLGLTMFREEFSFPSPSPGAQASLVTWLAVGTLVGGLLQLLVQLPSVLRITRGLRPSLRTNLPGVRRTIAAFGPVVAGRGVVQLNAYVVDVFLASFLAVGALSALRFGQMLYLLPISLFGMAVAAAELPELSSMDPEQRHQLVDRLHTGMRRIAFFVAPTTIGYLLVGDRIVGAIFQTGEFDRTTSIQVWIVLVGYSFGLLASTASRLLQSALYGIGDPKTPAKVAVVRVLVAVAIGVPLMFQLDQFQVTQSGVNLVGELPAFRPVVEDLRDPEVVSHLERLGAAGLSVAAGLASWVEYMLLRRKVAAEIGPTHIGGGSLGRILIAAVAAGVAALLTRPLLSDLHVILAGTAAALIVAVVHIGVARLLGIPEAQQLDRLARRLTGRQ